jgi:hypothetical protein
MFVGGFVRFETVDALGNKCRWSQAGQRLAESRARNQSVTARVLGDLRFAPDADRSHLNFPPCTDQSETVTQSLRLGRSAAGVMARNLLI